MRIGLGISEDLPIEQQQAIAIEVEQSGLASIWTNEASGRDAFLLCQAWAAATTSIEVGVAVVPIWSRSPAQVAMAAATLQEASHGRFQLGLGVSHPATMGPWHGADFRRPLMAAGEYLKILRQLFAGEASHVDGDVMASRGFRLAVNPRVAAPRIHLAAMGPRMLQLAAEAADGALLNWSGPDEVARATSALRGHAPGAMSTTYVRMAVDPDPDRARAALADQFGRYAALPAYASHFERQGLASAVSAVRAAHREGRPAAEVLADEDLSKVGWWGAPGDDPTPMLASFAAAGLGQLIARVVVTDGDPIASTGHLLAVVGPAAGEFTPSG